MMKRTLAIIFLTCIISISTTLAQTAFTEMRDITGLELTAEMAPGVNLWNTLDAVCWWCEEHNGLESQTVWGQPLTTPDMIKSIADRGYKTLRLPVSWFNHMGPGPDYTIDEEWMDRVEEVANYAFDNDLYVILNIHHDDLKPDIDAPDSWLITTEEKREEVSAQLEAVWTQIATRFKDYGDYLIFETMNEPREVGSSYEWSGGSAEHREVVNKLNVVAVDAIRETGGNNASRFIMAPQVGANVASALDAMEIPNDDPNIIVSIHYYSPYNFCLNENLDEGGVTNWGTDEEIATLQSDIKEISDHFVSNGRAVVIGEWGAKREADLDDRIAYYQTFARACKDGDIAPMAWFYSYDRNELEWESVELEQVVIDAFDPERYTPNEEESEVLGVKNDALSIEIYPNPVHDTIHLTLPVSSASIEVLTADGKLWKSFESTGASMDIAVSDYPRGIYLLKIKSAESTFTERILLK